MSNTHNNQSTTAFTAALVRQLSAGLIVGLSAVIYSISYGALLFSEALVTSVSFAITAAMITAIIGALFGVISEEKTFISGPDSNTISVMAGSMAALASIVGSTALTVNFALVTVTLTSIFSALLFYALAGMRLAGMVRYIPFSVMAGFLASTGWLMCSGALNIIAEIPLSVPGLEAFIEQPFHPELLFSLAVVAALQWLSRWISTALLIPLVLITATAGLNLFLASGLCTGDACSHETWMFSGLSDAQWLPPWQLDYSALQITTLIQMLPSILMVSFVGLLTILISLASLEMSLRKEFDLNRVLKIHAVTACIGTFLGGFLGILSVGRTTLNQATGGGALSGIIAAGICLAALIGGSGALAYVPKAALGGLLLFLGLGMIKQWLWDQRKSATGSELAEIALILTLVANYGYLVGFGAGLVISCIIFITTYSKIPLVSLATDLSVLTSAVVRPTHQMGILRSHGQAVHIYRLRGYIFFGSAARIDQISRALDFGLIDCVILDFSDVSGIDRSAISVFQRALRRHSESPCRFYFVHTPETEQALKTIPLDAGMENNIHYFPVLDEALESAEDHLLRKHPDSGEINHCFDFLESPSERATFLSYCTPRQVSAGELLCREGEFSDAIYFVESGSLSVIKMAGQVQRRLAKLSKGAMAGEMAFYTDDARTATIIAAEDSLVRILDKDSLLRMRKGHPLLATRFDTAVILNLAGSLKRANGLIANWAHSGKRVDGERP